jgi:hypothetical protein
MAPARTPIKKLFDSERFEESFTGASANPFESIGRILQAPWRGDSDALATKAHMYMSFMHEPSQTEVFFKAFITAFNETYSSDWASETVFGRTDPIHHFKQTSRRITLSFKVPAATYSEAYENLGRAQSLIQMLYPNYSSVGSAAQTITQNPFIRLKVMNLLRKAPAGGGQTYSEYKSSGDADKGVLGVITNLTINHNLENKDVGVLQQGPNTILPKMIEINLDFNPVHEHRIGWNGRTPDRSGFPYGYKDGVDSAKETSEAVTGFDERIEEIQAKARLKKMAEQDRANAEARYQTAWGKSRFNKDKKFIAGYEKREDRLNELFSQDAALTDKEVKELKSLAKSSRKQSANYDYLRSSQRGAEDSKAAGDTDYDFVE